MSRSLGRFPYLAGQFQNGAPADVSIFADRKWVDRLDSLGLVEAGNGADLLGDLLAVVAPRSSA